MQYFGGKQRISKPVSNYINQLLEDSCVIWAERQKLKKTLAPSSTHTHTHTHTHYAEPFCGACNIAVNVECEDKQLNDKHKYLIAMFQKLQKGWLPPKEVSEEYYYVAKKNQDNAPWLAGFVGFACSFAGKWWGGYARDNNGGNYALRGYNSILKKMQKLQNATFTCKDFTELEYEDTLIYCDPPYRNTTQYCKSILGSFDYDLFLNWARVQNNKEGNLVLISEYKHNLPDDGKIVLEIPSRTSIRDKEGNVIETTEILFTFK